MRIMHITEALGGGVLNIIQQLATMQCRDGSTVAIVHSIRSDTPPHSELINLFPTPIERIELFMTTNISPFKDLAAIYRIIRLVRKFKPDVVHLHSSKAGVLGRIACKLAGRSKSCFYTPHGFSFLRQDLSPKTRTLFALIERLCSYFGGTTIACSQSELEHAVNSAGQKKSFLVENCIPLNLVKPSVGGAEGVCRVSTTGRLSYPKNPSAFRELATQLQDQPACFLWIGGGELYHELLVDNVLPSNIVITGWVDREQVISHLSISDIFVMTSLWEGMPLALIEAQASGLPAVVPDVEGCRDIVINGVTGFICKDATEMLSKTKILIQNVELRRQMGAAAREQAIKRFSQNRMHREMLYAYTRC